MMTFSELGVDERILRAIDEMGFVTPMPVQEEVIPYLLGTGNDVIALAQTGTGKTAAYGIPLLQKTDDSVKDTQAVIICPTRELCLQITDDLKDFGKYMPEVRIVAVYGGAGIDQQMRSLRKGAQIIVATPGRLIDLMQRGVADLSSVVNVVLDEADEMLNMGFSESIDAILEGVPSDRNTLLFSATMSKEIEKIAKTYLKDYKEIVVGSRNEGAENVNHIFYLVNAKDKYLALKRIVDYYPKIFAIIFCRTKKETQEIADKLISDGYNAEALHGDLSQPQRDLTMQKFRTHLTQLLVATDVAARGLDVDDLTHVINFGLPGDIESYTHRSGRTGRAGKKGTSISIIHTKEMYRVRDIEKEIGKKFVDGTLPTAKEICTKQLYRTMDMIEKTDVNEEEIAPFMTDVMRHFEYVDKEDILKKIVSMTFGRFLAYYADAPEIERPQTKKEKRKATRDVDKAKGGNAAGGAEKGFRRLYVNLGKDDGFYPGEVMMFLNRCVAGPKVGVGHIDLYDRYSYVEVRNADAKRVIKSLDGAWYGDREVKCSEYVGTKDTGKRQPKQSTRSSDTKKKRMSHKDDWKQFFSPAPKRKHNAKDIQFKGDEPDFTEEGWARRRKRK